MYRRLIATTERTKYPQNVLKYPQALYRVPWWSLPALCWDQGTVLISAWQQANPEKKWSKRIIIIYHCLWVRGSWGGSASLVKVRDLVGALASVHLDTFFSVFLNFFPPAQEGLACWLCHGGEQACIQESEASAQNDSPPHWLHNINIGKSQDCQSSGQGNRILCSMEGVTEPHC